MTTNLKLSVVIPAYNEAARLRGSVEELLRFLRERDDPFEVVIVDDGSTDRTGRIAASLAESEPEIFVVSHEVNRGKGAAVRSGVLTSRGAAVLFSDADAPVPWPDLERLEAKLAGGADVAIGSKALGGAALRSVGVLRRLMSRIFNIAVQILVVRGVADTQCGFKLFTAQAARDLFGRTNTDGFSFDVEVLYLAKLRGYRIAEVPVRIRQMDGTSINLLADSLRMLRDLVRLRWRYRQIGPNPATESGLDASSGRGHVADHPPGK